LNSLLAEQFRHLVGDDAGRDIGAAGRKRHHDANGFRWIASTLRRVDRSGECKLEINRQQIH
jgi:hypothetical protein